MRLRSRWQARVPRLPRVVEAMRETPVHRVRSDEAGPTLRGCQSESVGRLAPTARAYRLGLAPLHRDSTARVTETQRATVTDG